ncbi:prenyltransferase [Chloroflexota bacterium]
MIKPINLKALFLETRPQFLTLSVVLAFLGTAIAWHEATVHLWYAVLAGVGLLLAHISVNTLNDYFDYKSGIDLVANRTPFSGGSGILPAGALQPKQVLWLGLVSLLLAACIGAYFMTVSGWQLFPLLLAAAILILLYSPLILKWPWPEWVAGVGLGILPVLGMYFVQAGTYTFSAVIASVPSGLLVYNLLLLNEFPDAEADMMANRKTLPIVIGKKKTAIVYTAVALAVYIWVIAWVAAQIMPLWTLLALLTLPLTIKAINGARHHDNLAYLMPGMASNVMVVLLTQLLIGLGYILAHAI